MSSPNPEAFLTVLLLEAITDLSSSIFTIICLSVTGPKCNRISTVNRILVALSASNICFTFTMSANFLISFVWPHLFENMYVMCIVYYLTIYSITSTSWLTSALCFFYFLKIIPSQPRILTNLKKKTSTIIGGFLLAAEVVSLGGSFLSIKTVNLNAIQTNSTEKLEEPTMGRVTFHDIVLALNSPPFFIVIVTMVVSASLLKHYNSQMKKTTGNINVKDYQTAIQTMTALLIYYLLTFLTMTIFSLNSVNTTTWGYWICAMILFSFPTVQSALLIYGNPKLKEALRKVYTFIVQTIAHGSAQ